MINIRRYTAISGIVNIVYYIDDRVAFDFAMFNNKIIAIRTKAYEIQQSTHSHASSLHYADAK